MELILCSTMIDGTGAEGKKNVAIQVEDGKICAITPIPETIPEDVVVWDLRAYTVLPGFVDCHDHFCIDMGDEAAQCRQPDIAIAIHSTANAERILRSGITTVRDCGEKNYIDIELKKAIESGDVVGPRIVTAGMPVMRTGGHGYYLGVEADGPDEVRKAVRMQLKAGAELIKIFPSGGSSTKGSSPTGLEMTKEEIEAAIDEAHRAGRKVAAHIHGGPAAKICIEAGVDSLEHGARLTDEESHLLAESNTYLVSTGGLSMVALASDNIPDFYREKLEIARKSRALAMSRAYKYGTKIACGNDTNHGRMDLEMKALVEYGMTPLEAIRCGTRNGADLCGLLDVTGTLEVGKFADLIAVNGDPLENVENVKNPVFVMKEGKCYVNNL